MTRPRLGRDFSCVKIGRLQMFTVQRPRRAVYADWLPGGWRLVVSQHPVWLNFSERYGYAPPPRIWRLGPVDIAWKARP